jgi:hypothetical protein
MLYERPYYYMVSHILIGFVAAWIPLLGFLAILYQLYQYAFGIRIFPVEGVIQKGNSISHTSLKLAEIGVGYLGGKGTQALLSGSARWLRTYVPPINSPRS